MLRFYTIFIFLFVSATINNGILSLRNLTGLHYEFESKASTEEQKIIHILDNIPNIIYFYKHRWDIIKYKHTLEYDFYCIYIYDNNLVQFVIEFDGEQHYQIKKDEHIVCHIRDIIKQYYLSELNIHLLRLNKSTTISDTIENFIKEIVKTNTYIIKNAIQPKEEYFQNTKVNAGLDYFCKVHSVMHGKCFGENSKEI